MKKIMEIYKENKWIDYVIILIIGLIICIPLIGFYIVYNTHDGLLHMFRLKGTISALLIGEFPPFIAPEFSMSAGFAMCLFYAPIVTYIPMIINLLTNDYMASMKLLETLFIVISGMTMYSFTKQVTQKRLPALIAGILYIIVPYNIGNYYVRFAIGEVAGLAFMPLVWIGVYNLLNQDGRKHYYIAIGATLVFLSHMITTFYLAIFCGVYLLLNIKRLKSIQIIKKLLINLVFILTIAMFYYLPMLEAKNFTEYAIFDDGYMYTNSKYVKENALELKQLVDRQHEERAQVLIIGAPILVCLLLTIYAFNKIDKKYKWLYIIFFAFSIISLFMATKYFPWEHMPDLVCKVQFAWRLLGFFGFFITFVCAINLYIFVDKLIKNNKIKLSTLLILLVISIVYSMQLISEYKVHKYDNYVVDLNNKNDLVTHMNYEYLPMKIFKAPKGFREYIRQKENKVIVLKGNVNIVNQENNNLSITIDVKNMKRNTILEFPLIYYPGYEMTLTKKNEITKLDVQESEYGYIMTKVKQDVEEGKIELKYKGTIISKISCFISLIAIICFIVYIRYEKKSRR